MNILLRLLLLSVLTTILTQCATAPRKTPPISAGPKAQEEIAKAQVEMAAGSDKKAIQRLRTVVTKYPGSDVSDDAAILIGQIHFKNREYLLAYESFMSVVNSDVFSPSEGDALLWAARSLHKLGRLDEALALTQKTLKVPGLSAPMLLENHKLRFHILSELGDRLEALKALLYLAEHDPDEKARNGHQLKALDYVSSRLTEAELAKVADSSEFKLVRAPALLKYAILLFEQRDFSKARGYFIDVTSLVPNTESAERADSYIRQIDARRTVDPKTIGAVLPLTGKHSAVGYKTLRGIQLGLGIYGRESSDFRLAIVDAEDNPDQARKAVERLVTEDSVVAIIGSLLSRTSTAVAAKADELGVPSICLSQKAGITEIGSMVFRNALTSQMQVRHIVNTAMNDLGLRRFGILFPNDAYGVEFANLFWDEVLANGGTITAAQTYTPNSTDFSGPIERMIGTYYPEDRTDEYKHLLKEWQKNRTSITARSAPPEDLLPPVVDFEALFIPDSSKALSQIAPNLAFHDVSNVWFLGTNLWNTETLAKTNEKYLQRALFVDSNFSGNEDFKKSTFFKEYRAVFGEDPGLFEAQGYDAALAIRQTLASGERTRSGVADRLKGLSQFRGALGVSQMTSRRELTRPTLALAIHEGKILRFQDVPKEQKK